MDGRSNRPDRVEREEIIFEGSPLLCSGTVTVKPKKESAPTIKGQHWSFDFYPLVSPHVNTMLAMQIIVSPIFQPDLIKNRRHKKWKTLFKVIQKVLT